MERLHWTADGRAALAAELAPASTLHEVPDAELRTQLAKTIKKFTTAWKRGLAKADSEGSAAVALALAGKLGDKDLVKLDETSIAGLLSLVGAYDSENLHPLGELVIRKRGVKFATRVLARMWSQVSRYYNPTWPKSIKKLAVWITAIEDDHDHVHDTSVSYSKGTFTHYLQATYQRATAARRKEMKQTVTAIWKDVPPHARPALAVATQDAVRAKQSAKELLHAGESPYPYFAWSHLPHLIKDAELALELLRDDAPSYALLANVGAALFPLYLERIGSSIDRNTRADYLAQLANLRGPRVAKLLAEYEDTAEYAPTVRAYFTAHPDLLEQVLRDPELAYHHDDLARLRQK